MTVPLTDEKAGARRVKILTAARWCFLNFGFAKTSFEEIARRADLSRTLLYRVFKEKDDIFRAVFDDWMISRQPAAKLAATGQGTAYERLLNVCRVMRLEPWEEMVGTPMGGELHKVCARIAPESESLCQKIVLDCVHTVLGDEASAKVFILALDGLIADHPSVEVVEQRIQLLAARFTVGLSNNEPPFMTTSPAVQEIVVFTDQNNNAGVAVNAPFGAFAIEKWRRP